MLTYQYLRGWRQYIRAWLVVSGLLAFVGEPVYTWLNLYHPMVWKYHYSFIAYFSLAVAIKWLTGRIVSGDVRYAGKA